MTHMKVVGKQLRRTWYIWCIYARVLYNGIDYIGLMNPCLPRGKTLATCAISITCIFTFPHINSARRCNKFGLAVTCPWQSESVKSFKISRKTILSWQTNASRILEATVQLYETSLIARFTEPNGAHLWPTGPRWAPCWHHIWDLLIH